MTTKPELPVPRSATSPLPAGARRPGHDAGTAERRPLRVMVIDGHPVFRAGLRGVLARAGDLEAAAEARDADEAARQAATLRPDVAVMDPHATDRDAATATRRVVAASPATRALVLTERADLGAVLAAVRAGARGYLLKAAPEREILSAIRAVGRGHVCFGAGVADRLLEHLANAERPPVGVFGSLSQRERDVLDLLAEGAATGEIARRLHLSQKTVRNYTSSICSKLGVADRTQAALRAREAGYGGTDR